MKELTFEKLTVVFSAVVICVVAVSMTICQVHYDNTLKALAEKGCVVTPVSGNNWLVDCRGA